MKSPYQPRYQSPIPPRVHPVQVLRKAALDISNKKNPIREEVEKCLGTHTLVAEITEDTDTLATMKPHVEGLVAFLCTLRKGSRVIAQGRGSAIMNPNNRWVKRAIQSAFNSALSDAVIRATKVLGTIVEPEQKQPERTWGAACETEEPILATDRQKQYLTELIAQNFDDPEEQERRQAGLSTLTRFEASEMIKSFR